ncbi:hypothetical protein FIBSPDRAFT_1050574 [Athelia psychrophila]|uniref:Uncharacterized protein n=1 Tax=Athelia psychrophila TaxID=1759441 RepID=A0A166AIN9_9AGAM|nr:hypothetical protein FIBSPDRAFT_1050574 [Fibularhizoctonia sp. CBS 109695]
MPTSLQAAWRGQLVTYVFTANSVMYAYDWVLSVSEEVELVSAAGLSWPIAIYFLSRAAMFIQMCLTWFLQWLSEITGDCDALVKLYGACAGLSIASTSFLFLLRVRAVYMRSARTTAIFGTLWIVTVAFATHSATTIHADPKSTYVHSGCGVSRVKSISSTWMLVPMLFTDTLIFLAITYRLTADAATKGSWRSRFLIIAKGKGLYSLSRSLMLTGQFYYLSTIAYILVHFAIIWQPPAPTGTLYTLASLYAGYTNMMACRVFRGVALGTMHMEAPSAGLTSTRIAAAFDSYFYDPPQDFLCGVARGGHQAEAGGEQVAKAPAYSSAVFGAAALEACDNCQAVAKHARITDKDWYNHE